MKRDKRTKGAGKVTLKSVLHSFENDATPRFSLYTKPCSADLPLVSSKNLKGEAEVKGPYTARAILLILTLQACDSSKKSASPAPQELPGDSGGSGCLHLANGVPTQDYPAVVRLLALTADGASICTGTFISPTAVMTAAHCIDSSANGGVSYVPGAKIDFDSSQKPSGMVAAQAAFAVGPVGEAIDAQDPTSVAQDVAILIFPKGLTRSYLGIEAQRPAPGTKVDLVAYGLTSYPDAELDPQYDASKHKGSTQVIAGDEEVNIYVGGYSKTEAQAAGSSKAVNNSGDSGGPLLVNGSIAGTLSVGGVDTMQASPIYFAAYVDINRPLIRELIGRANAAGAGIPDAGTNPGAVCTGP